MRTKHFVTGEDHVQRVLACTWLPLYLANLCLERDCEAVFAAGEPTCPACGSKQWMPLQRWLGQRR